MEERFNMICTQDIDFLRQAMTLAQCGEGCVNPNPLVGAVIVRSGEVIGQGYHARYGDLHAERNAFRYTDSQHIDCSGATMYVTLEPCCHHGHQPPCTEAIIEHRIARVVVGLLDPNPLVAGHGIEILRQKGIEVEVLDPASPLADELRLQNRVFLHYITTQRPWVVMKYAMTLDGKICTSTGDSQWITGAVARQRVHRLRKSLSAILCGIGTVLADDPMLNTRIEGEPEARNPIRFVLDHHLRLPLDSQLVRTAREIPVIAVHDKDASPSRIDALHKAGVQTWCCSSLDDLLQRMGAEHIDSVLVEGGGTVNDSFLQARLVNEVYAFVAPKLVGGKEAKTPVEGQGIENLRDAVQFSHLEVEHFGQDVLLHGVVSTQES
jgi:diaminohydroxyphosphoribosylaminopyrimidine deaminase/5-amino-6-(5-phosphoribosylamino)uracil reductase